MLGLWSRSSRLRPVLNLNNPLIIMRVHTVLAARDSPLVTSNVIRHCLPGVSSKLSRWFDSAGRTKYR